MIRLYAAISFLAFSGASAIAADGEIKYPEHANVVVVTRPPYNAKGDGKTDDTAALQLAINENTGRHRVLFFPPGTYVISDTLTWPKNWKGRENWGFTTLQGQAASKCILKLKDGTFTDPAKPKSMMWCGGFGSADWFHNHIHDLTFDVGRGNAGAVGLQFYANNHGAVRRCDFTSDDGSGLVGLDLGHRDMNGPLLVRRVRVTGFRRGIKTGNAVNGQTLEHITLKNQSEFGIDNEGQSLTVRGLISENTVPAVRSYGTFYLTEATLTGRGNADKVPAIINYNGGRMGLRDIATTGYGRALGDVRTPDYVEAFRLQGEDKPGSLGPKIAEYFSHDVTSAFPSATGSLRLPIEETPEFPQDDVKTWAVVDSFGADPNGGRDSTAAIQKALDSGASTIFLPGFYTISKPLIVRGKVRRIVGIGGWTDYNSKVLPNFRVEAGSADVVTFEHIAKVGGGILNATDRTLVLRSIGTSVFSKGKGKLFLEDIAGDKLEVGRQKVFARQLNIENEGTHLRNDGGDVWILGYKTERGGTLVHTRNGGRTEVLGGFSYTTTAGKLAPMFVNDRSSIFAFFGEVCYSGDPFQTLIEETRGELKKTIRRDAGGTWPYIGVPQPK